jgi:hypothetical protein
LRTFLLIENTYQSGYTCVGKTEKIEILPLTLENGPTTLSRNAGQKNILSCRTIAQKMRVLEYPSDPFKWSFHFLVEEGGVKVACYKYPTSLP